MTAAGPGGTAKIIASANGCALPLQTFTQRPGRRAVVTGTPYHNYGWCRRAGHDAAGWTKTCVVVGSGSYGLGGR
jgi:hypothetical protein